MTKPPRIVDRRRVMARPRSHADAPSRIVWQPLVDWRREGDGAPRGPLAPGRPVVVIGRDAPLPAPSERSSCFAERLRRDGVAPPVLLGHRRR